MEYKILLILFFLLVPLSAPAHAGHAQPGDIAVHYHRPDGDYAGWTLWTWNQTAATCNVELKQAGMDEFGAIFMMDAKKYGEGKIGILPRLGEWVKKDDPNRVIDAKDFQGAGGRDVYIVSGMSEAFHKKPDISPFIKRAFLDAANELTIVFSRKLKAADVKKLRISAFDNMSKIEYTPDGVVGIFAGSGTHETRVVKALFKAGLGPDGWVFKKLEARAEGYRPKQVTPRDILYSGAFHYKGALGAIYKHDHTTFRVFSPAADSIETVLYDTHDGPQTGAFPMKRIGHGAWEVSAPGNLINKYYRYRVSIDGVTSEALDPYAACQTAHNGRSVVTRDTMEVPDGPRFTIDEAVIYEMHVRDFTIDPNASFKFKGKFLGVAEEDARLIETPDIKAGMAHLKELGINTVQILPIQDFENDEKSGSYNWGYMPVHFNSPDGWYASRTDDASRIKEAKAMIAAFHRNGIKVVMDVVYNHTAECNEMVKYSFNALAPNYYYRTKIDGEYWNGSGCGNEFKSESPMGRRFIIDSLKHWVVDYNIDGFRFDLMGLIDLETVCLLVEELKKIRPDIFIYGEPWAAGDTPIKPTIKGAQRGHGFAVFNDIFRDSIKGSVWDLKGGFVQGTTDAEVVSRGVIGSIDDFASSPLESINYCEAHDNRTLYDTLIATTKQDVTITPDKIKKMHMLSTLLVLTAQGVPFLHAGQEIMRTKNGEENSYNKPDSVNMIDWGLKIENRDVFEFVKRLIAMRKAQPIFRMKTSQQIRKSIKLFAGLGIKTPKNCLAFVISGGHCDHAWKSAAVLANPNREKITVKLPHGDWHVFMHNYEFVEGRKAGHEITLEPISAAILYKL